MITSVMSRKLGWNTAEGVFATKVEVNGDPLQETDFKKAYKDGKYEEFSFGKRIFEENKVGKDAYELRITFTLVANPDFAGFVKEGQLGFSCHHCCNFNSLQFAAGYGATFQLT